MYKFIILILIIYSDLLAHIIDFNMFKSMVTETNKMIIYGKGKKGLCFDDEIVNHKNGHCGDYAKLLLRKLIKKGFDAEIVSIRTQNGLAHAMVEVNVENKKILLDATTNIVYRNSVLELMINPLLAKRSIGKSMFPMYSNVYFWEGVKTISFIPVIKCKTIKIFSIKSKTKFYKDHKLSIVINGTTNTYAAGYKDIPTKISIDFEKTSYLSSLLIVPYNYKNYPSSLQISCPLNNKIIYKNENITLKRGVIPINFDDKIKCKHLDITFFSFKGQNRFLLRNIYLYGK